MSYGNLAIKHYNNLGHSSIYYIYIHLYNEPSLKYILHLLCSVSLHAQNNQQVYLYSI